MKYTCPRCRYNTDDIRHFKRHYERGRECKVLYDDISIEDCMKGLSKDKYKCEKCCKEYKYLTSYTNHKCSSFGQNESSDKVVNQMINTHLVGNNNTVNNVNININAFRDSDYEHLRGIIMECMENKQKLSITKLIKLAHFSDEHPENRNIYLTDLKRKKLHVFNGDYFEHKYSGKEGIDKALVSILTKISRKFNCKYLLDNYINADKSEQNNLRKSVLSFMFL